MLPAFVIQMQIKNAQKKKKAGWCSLQAQRNGVILLLVVCLGCQLFIDTSFTTKLKKLRTEHKDDTAIIQQLTNVEEAMAKARDADKNKITQLLLKGGAHDPALQPTLVPDNFNWEHYLRLNQDLGIAAGIKTREMSEWHYLCHGQQEGRKYEAPESAAVPDQDPAWLFKLYEHVHSPVDFDWVMYLNNNRDVVDRTRHGAMVHYVCLGTRESRSYAKDGKQVAGPGKLVTSEDSGDVEPSSPASSDNSPAPELSKKVLGTFIGDAENVAFGIPDNFDWQFYFDASPDLRAAGFVNEFDAR